MRKYYVTFGQKSPFRNGWVEIVADSEEIAKDKADFAIRSWSMIYDNDNFQPELFQAGKLGVTI